MMSILEAHGENISKIEMDCYKIKKSIQYTSKDYTSDSTTQQTSRQAKTMKGILDNNSRSQKGRTRLLCI